MADGSPARGAYSLQLFGVCAGLTALALKQAPALLVGDTKLDLAVDPMGLLRRALHLWDPTRDFGVTQNQNYGYLFPMGPFFALGKVMALPAWAVQRLWWATLLCVAFLGLVRLAEALGIGTASSRLLAGLAFALSPRVLTTLGPISVETLPYCLAPWVLVPLVRGAACGSPRRAAARSAVAVLLMGAVNAAAVLAALPPAVLWLITRRSGPRRRQLALWWAGCVLLATGWWLGPLLLLGRYSPPFLDHIESAAVTTAGTSLIEVLRGTSHWVAALGGVQGPTWPAGHALLTMPLVVAYTVVVLLGGLAGLLRSDLPERLWLTAGLLLGVAAVTAGHLGPLQGLLAGVEHTQLDGVLAPFRNVHKFDVVLRLPLTLGLAHLLGRLSRGNGAGAPDLRQQRVVTVAALAAVVGAALPALGVGIAPRRPFAEIPAYWRQTAGWLASHRDAGAALLLPGSSFPDYLWGSSNDEPLEPLARSAWAVRSAVPLTPTGTIRALDAVEQRLAAGQPSVGLAEDVARMGIAHVVVRNDLAYPVAGSTRPLLVHAALAGSPGFRRVAAFGPPVGGGAAGMSVDQGLEVPYRAVEVFAVEPARPGVELSALADAAVVQGGPEALLELADHGLLRGRPVVLATDAGGVGELDANVRLLTDTPRRREVSFGRLYDNTSPTLTAGEQFRLSVPAHDYLDGTAGLTVARLVGARSVSAASSAADAGVLTGADPGAGAYAAVDGDPATSWRPDGGRGVAGARWRIDFRRPRPLLGLRLVFGPGERPARLLVSAAGGARVLDVPAAGPLSADLPGDSDHLEVAAVADGRRRGSLALAEVVLPDLAVRRTIEPPRAPSAGAIVLSVAPGDRRGCYDVGPGPLCAEFLGRRGEEPDGLQRTVRLDRSDVFRVSASARPVAGPALDALLDHGAGVAVSASSSAVDEPAGRPAAAYDGSDLTGWRAATGDHDPALTLRWPTRQTVSGLRLVVAPTLAASRATRVTVAGDSGPAVEAAVTPGGLVSLRPPLVTRRLTVHLQGVQVAATVDPFDRQLRVLPVGLSELTVRGAAPSRPVGARIRLPCGAGPPLRIGAATRRTSFDAARGDVVARQVIDLAVCDDAPVEVDGTTELSAPATTTLAPVSVELIGAAARAAPGPSSAPATPVWTAARRRVQLPPRLQAQLLRVHENVNAGWTARLAGRVLRPVTLDGWQQGWVVPPGAAGLVHLDYRPDVAYRLALLTGGLLVLLLLALALLPPRSADQLATEGASARPVTWAGAVVLAGVLALVGGPAAVGIGLLAAAAGRRYGSSVPAVVGLAAVAVCGALVSLAPFGTSGYPGSGALVQALCLVGLGAVWSGLVRGRGTATAVRRPRSRGASTNR